MDPYKTLGVSRDSSQDAIRAAYRKLAKKLHPDLNPGNKQAEQRFKEASAAYELIGTAEARAKFDRGEERAEEGARERASRRGPFYYETQGGPEARYRQYASEGSFDEELLRSMFGAAHAAQSRPVVYSLEVDFRDAALGAARELALPNGKRIKISIPGGVQTGARLRLAGQGEPRLGGGPLGDAYVQIVVKPSAVFQRKGADLLFELPISLGEAVLGAEIKIPTLEGEALVMIPPGTDTGRKLRLKGKGAVDPGTGKRGDLLAEVRVHLPAGHDPSLEEALRDWIRNHPYNPRESGGAKAA